MFEPDKGQWNAIAVGFFMTVLIWLAWEERGYPPNTLDKWFGVGRFFVPIGFALYVWYLETNKGKKP